MKFATLKVIFLLYLVAFVELSSVERRGRFSKFSRKAKKVHTTRSSVESSQDFPREGCVWMYEDCNFGGTKWERCNDVDDLDWAIQNETSSVKTGPNTVAVLFADNGYSGGRRVVQGSNSCLSDFNDETDSIRVVSKGCVLFFEHCDYNGANHKICGDAFNLSDMGFNDQVSSVIVPPGTTVFLYEHDNMGGRSLELTSSRNCLVADNFNDLTTSIRVTGGDVKNYTVNTSNSFFSFVVGMIEGCADNETGFYECLPDAWKKDTGADPGQTGALDTAYQGWSAPVRKFLEFSSLLISAVCWVRSTVISILSYISDKLFGRRRMMFLEGKAQNKSSRFMTRSHMISSIAKTWMKSKSEVAAKIDLVPDWVKDWFRSIADKLNEWYQKIKAFFESETWQNIMRIVNCILSAKTAGQNLIDVFNGIKGKYEVFTRAIKLTGFVVLIVLIDMLVGLICNWEKFKRAINYFIAAWNRSDSDKAMKWFYYGKATGTLINAIATAETVSETVNDAFNKATGKGRFKRRFK